MKKSASICKNIFPPAVKNTVLGIDPGTQIMGYALLSFEGNRAELITMDVLNLKKIESHQERIRTIFEKVSELIEQYRPNHLAIEAPFFGKNVQSMLKLGRAQGVAIAAALSHGIPFCEYEPRRVKQSITGNGAASKEQVAGMLQRLLNFGEIPDYLDATDALGIAYCFFLQSGNPLSGEARTKKKVWKTTSWESFISENQSRVKY